MCITLRSRMYCLIWLWLMWKRWLVVAKGEDFLGKVIILIGIRVVVRQENGMMNVLVLFLLADTKNDMKIQYLGLCSKKMKKYSYIFYYFFKYFSLMFRDILHYNKQRDLLHPLLQNIPVLAT